MKKDIPQIGMTYQVLNREGVYNLKEIAEEYYEQQEKLDNSNLWAHDRYLKTSSNSRAEVFTPSNNSFKDCSINIKSSSEIIFENSDIKTEIDPKIFTEEYMTNMEF